jgi:hypothetical protein
MLKCVLVLVSIITDGSRTFMIGVSQGNFGGVTVFLLGMLFLRVIRRKILELFMSDGWLQEMRKRLKHLLIKNMRERSFD